jgi:hypothetical protein
MRLSNGELADRLRLMNLHPNRFSNIENKAIIEEAADRLDTKNEIQVMDFPNGHKLYKFVVNGQSYYFPNEDQAIAFRIKVSEL